MSGEDNKSSSKSGGGGGEIGNPLYCSYIEGVYTYKDPITKNEFCWDESNQIWIPKVFNGFPVTTATSSGAYQYTENDGTVMEFDTEKNAWFPKGKKREADNFSTNSGEDNRVSSENGFNNPNYSQPRRFYYAALSPSSMGITPAFLSPDDQINNNSVDPQLQVQFPSAESNSIQQQQQQSSNLPSGWERHEDANGPYYWHIKSGTIQRDPPANPALIIPGKLNTSLGLTMGNSSNNSSSGGGGGNSRINSNSSNTNSNAFPQGSKMSTSVHLPHLDNKMIEENLEKQKENLGCSNPANWTQFLENSSSSSTSSSSSNNSLKFIAVSLGFLQICEEDLTPERSSKAVSKVINELTSCKSEFAGKIWNTLSEIYLELDESHLRVRNDQMILQEQPIHSIRVWGVGREDTRDFAFVAREKKTRQFLCHVFRLEMNARPLASALRDACKRIMIERQKKNKRPDSLPMSKKQPSTSASFFPTPMDEPRKILKAYYLGSTVVTKASGIETINNAIETCMSDEKIPVSVSVAPSVLQITSEEPSKEINIEIRVRFLSFMGIGRDIKTCGFIVHTANDSFEAHCFFSTPSSGALVRSIEAACVLRYQKCLDSHHHGTTSNTSATSSIASNITSPTNSLANAFKNVLGVFGRKNSEEK